MFDVLLESHHVRPPRAVVATTLSAALHAALVIALVGGTAAVASNEDLNPLWQRFAKFLAPPDVRSVVGGEHVSFVGLAAQGSPKGEKVGAAVQVKENATAGDPVIPQEVVQAVQSENKTMELAAAAQSVGAFTIIDVDSVAERDPLSAAPVYPKDLLQKNIEGEAILQFVIDSTGLVDLSTIKVVDATHQEFVKAVRDAMPRMRYRPAIRGGQPARQLVEEPFKFEINHPAPVARSIKPD